MCRTTERRNRFAPRYTEPALVVVVAVEVAVAGLRALQPK
jgi:hypothetical protein